MHACTHLEDLYRPATNTGDEIKLLLSQVIRFVDQDERICKVLAAALQQVAPQLLSQVGLIPTISITLDTVALPITAQTNLSADAAAVQAGSDTRVVCCSPLSIQQQCWHSSMRTFHMFTKALLWRTHAVTTLPPFCNETFNG